MLWDVEGQMFLLDKAVIRQMKRIKKDTMEGNNTDYMVFCSSNILYIVIEYCKHVVAYRAFQS